MLLLVWHVALGKGVPTRRGQGRWGRDSLCFGRMGRARGRGARGGDSLYLGGTAGGGLRGDSLCLGTTSIAGGSVIYEIAVGTGREKRVFRKLRFSAPQFRRAQSRMPKNNIYILLRDLERKGLGPSATAWAGT